MDITEMLRNTVSRFLEQEQERRGTTGENALPDIELYLDTAILEAAIYTELLLDIQEVMKDKPEAVKVLIVEGNDHVFKILKGYYFSFGCVCGTNAETGEHMVVTLYNGLIAISPA